MSWGRLGRRLAASAAAAWLPIVVSCQPGDWDGVVRVVADGWWSEPVIVEEWEEECCGDCCGWWDGCGGHFHFYYDD